MLLLRRLVHDSYKKNGTDQCVVERYGLHSRWTTKAVAFFSFRSMPSIFSKFEMTTFECMICAETKEIINLVPQSTLGCKCDGLISNPCWFTDFQTRQKTYYVTKKDGVTSVSCWFGKEQELYDHLASLFFDTPLESLACLAVDEINEQTREEYKEYLMHHMYFGRSCPSGEFILFTPLPEPTIYPPLFQNLAGKGG